MTKKLKIILFFSVVCLLVAGVFLARLEISDFFSGYFSNIWKGDETQTQTAPNLVLLTSHSHPQAGEKWVVSFETKGTGDLTITPTDSDSIGDLDFASMKCAPSVALAEEGFGQEVNPEIQAGDVLFVPNWSCDGVGIVTHLVNIARKHTLKFQFGGKAAFAYNNPDSVTDTFTDESKIASKSNITVSGGQVRLSACGDSGNGTACTLGSECCSNNCIDGYCCNSACGGTCQACVFSKTGSATGTCANITSNTDPDSECAGTCKVCQSGSCGNATADTDTEGSCTGNCDECNGSGACRGDNTYCANTGSSCYCSGSGTSYSCQACLNTTSSCNCSGYACQSCSDPGLCKYPTCSSYTCGSANEAINYQETGCNGCNYCNISGTCVNCSWVLQGGPYAGGCFRATPYTCKASTHNSQYYSWTDSAVCSDALLGWGTPDCGDSAYKFKCTCQ